MSTWSIFQNTVAYKAIKSSKNGSGLYAVCTALPVNLKAGKVFLNHAIDLSKRCKYLAVPYVAIIAVTDELY